MVFAVPDQRHARIFGQQFGDDADPVDIRDDTGQCYQGPVPARYFNRVREGPTYQEVAGRIQSRVK